MWRFDGERLSMLRLKGGSYEEVGTSEVFPGASAQFITRLLAQGKALGGPGWLRLTRAWAQELYGKSSETV